MSRIEMMEFADTCNRNAGFPSIPENHWRGRRKWLARYLDQRGMCAICGAWFAPAEMTKDHIVPRGRDGGMDWDNIQLTCEPCNHAKGCR